MPLPQIPIYIPPELVKLRPPPPKSGLPFNAQLSDKEVSAGYVVPDPLPQPVPELFLDKIETDDSIRAMKERYEEFLTVLRRCTIKVFVPTDRQILELIHKTIEYILKEGPIFEAILITKEAKNPQYTFLYDNQSQEHVYYRWKLYSLLQGDSPNKWRTEKFQMFFGGPMWQPPDLNPYAGGMPPELIKDSSSQDACNKQPIVESKFVANSKQAFKEKERPVAENNTLLLTGTLGEKRREQLGDILRSLEPTKKNIGAAMLFCIVNSDAASEVVECVTESLSLIETPFKKKIARLFLISDILHNCHSPVTNSSFYREGFQSKLTKVFEYLREYLTNIEDRSKADQFKQKSLTVLSAWKEWTLYPDSFIITLSNILLGIESTANKGSEPLLDLDKNQVSSPGEAGELGENIDGDPIDDASLIKCLEAKGLSLRWYRALELSDDEEGAEAEENSEGMSPHSCQKRYRVASLEVFSTATAVTSEIQRFKTSKWETVDPADVAEQVVTKSKWEQLAVADSEGVPNTPSPRSSGEVSSSSDEQDKRLSERKRRRVE